MEDTRQKILNTAGIQFADKGYRGTTVREICREAGVNVAAINYYFGDKETLYREVITAAHPAEVAGKPDFPPGLPPREKLGMFIYGFLSHIRSLPSDSWHMRLIMRELTSPTSSCTDAVREIFQKRLDELLSILGELLPDAPEFLRKRLAFSIFGQCIVYRRDGVPQLLLGSREAQRHFRVDQLAEHILTATLASVGLAEPLFLEADDLCDEDEISFENGTLKGDATR